MNQAIQFPDREEWNESKKCVCFPALVNGMQLTCAITGESLANRFAGDMNRPGFPGECFICELRLPDHRFLWKHNKLFLLLPEEYGPAFPAIVDCYTSPPT